MDFLSLPLWLQLLALMLTNVSPGESHLSVEVMPECGTSKDEPTCDVTARVCEGRDPKVHGVLCGPPFWSDWYGSWVRYESAPRAAERYILLAKGLAHASESLLCAGAANDDCKPIQWGYDRTLKRNGGSARSLAFMGLAAALQESGLREDVRMGRGMARKNRSVDNGTGQGRGPGGEIGEMQVMAKMACRFASWLSQEEKKRCLDDPTFREENAQTMLGPEPEAIERSFEIGLRMLAHSREHCRRTFKPRPEDTSIFGTWVWSTFSYYGTGTSCDSANIPKPTKDVPAPSGKTIARAGTYDRFWNSPVVSSWVWKYFERRGFTGDGPLAVNP